jgi:pyruvate/2-oxoglutarate dehydrogenase complex dihydrolipoamide dehydrogenase (E3) component
MLRTEARTSVAERKINKEEKKRDEENGPSVVTFNPPIAWIALLKEDVTTA